jgi:(2R)-3-sulfolactate dehydrogenase (NADP+)
VLAIEEAIRRAGETGIAFVEAAKGAMLALIVEVLVTALTGSALGFEATSFFVDEGNRPRQRQAFLVIDPAALAGHAIYNERIETLIAAMISDSEVRLPGYRRYALAEKAKRDGVEISSALYDQLTATAR